MINFIYPFESNSSKWCSFTMYKVSSNCFHISDDFFDQGDGSVDHSKPRKQRIILR